jgi:hypothetical protein
MIMLFWEALQCNKRFRSFIIDTDRAHDFVVLVLYYAIDQRNDPTKQGLVRMCVFVLQTLSVEPNFGKSLNKTFEGQESLPPSIRIPNFHGTYADYVITVCSPSSLGCVCPNFASPSTPSSQPAKAGLMPCILPYWLFSTTSRHMFKTLVAPLALSCFNSSHPCHRPASCLPTKTTTRFSSRYWRC